MIQLNDVNDDTKLLRHELQHTRDERDRLLKERSLIGTVLSNESLQPTERIVALCTVFAVEHERSRGNGTATSTPAPIKAIAVQAGVSPDTAGKAIDRLSKFGAWDKSNTRTWDEERQGYISGVVLKMPGSMTESLRVLAHLAPTPEERKALTGAGKPGCLPGEKREKREKIGRTCPVCYSTNTQLECLTCGTTMRTDELVHTGGEKQKLQVTGRSQGNNDARAGGASVPGEARHIELPEAEA